MKCSLIGGVFVSFLERFDKGMDRRTGLVLEAYCPRVVVRTQAPCAQEYMNMYILNSCSLYIYEDNIYGKTYVVFTPVNL